MWIGTHNYTIVQILVHSHFDLVSSVLVQDAIEKVSQTRLNGSWTDKHSSHFSTAKEISQILFHVKTTANKNYLEMMLKSFWSKNGIYFSVKHFSNLQKSIWQRHCTLVELVDERKYQKV